MLGVFGDTMSLQQPMSLFIGVQGMELQHCMLCWFSISADMHDCTCKNRMHVAAITVSSRLNSISQTLRDI
jgi:hypothetical protein